MPKTKRSWIVFYHAQLILSVHSLIVQELRGTRVVALHDVLWDKRKTRPAFLCGSCSAPAGPLSRMTRSCPHANAAKRAFKSGTIIGTNPVKGTSL